MFLMAIGLHAFFNLRHVYLYCLLEFFVVLSAINSPKFGIVAQFIEFSITDALQAALPQTDKLLRGYLPVIHVGIISQKSFFRYSQHLNKFVWQ